MLDPEVLNAIRYAGERQVVSFVLEWRHTPNPVIYQDAITRRDKLERLRRFYDGVKQPLLEKLRMAGVQVQDLPASPQAVVTCTGKEWLQFGLDGGPLDDSAVRVLPNVTFESAFAR
jgi:hypothetical protein